MYRVMTRDRDGGRLVLVREGSFFVFAHEGDPDVATFATPTAAHDALHAWVETQERDRVDNTFNLSHMLTHARIMGGSNA